MSTATRVLDAMAKAAHGAGAGLGGRPGLVAQALGTGLEIASEIVDVATDAEPGRRLARLTRINDIHDRLDEIRRARRKAVER